MASISALIPDIDGMVAAKWQAVSDFADVEPLLAFLLSTWKPSVLSICRVAVGAYLVPLLHSRQRPKRKRTDRRKT